MRKIFAIILVLILSFGIGGCALLHLKVEEKTTSMESANKFYAKLTESKSLLDLVATDVCAVWKDASLDYDFSTKDVNDAIEAAKISHSDNIARIHELDKEICDLFDKAKDEVKDINTELALKRVMTSYFEYRDSVLNANDALNPSGYVDVSISKDFLDKALRDLFAEL